jgi:alpha-N-arabinofuranosidase
MEEEFMTKMEFEPTGENEEAGIACYQTSDTKNNAFVTLNEGQKVARICKTVGDMVMEAGNVPENRNEVYLKAVFDAKYFHFYISENGTSWTKIAAGQANLISNDVGRTLGGISLGLYASGNGEKCRRPADFDWFESHFTEVKFGDYLSMQ